LNQFSTKKKNSKVVPQKAQEYSAVGTGGAGGGGGLPIGERKTSASVYNKSPNVSANYHSPDAFERKFADARHSE